MLPTRTWENAPGAGGGGGRQTIPHRPESSGHLGG